MTPSQHLLTSSARGFICRSCRSKLHEPSNRLWPKPYRTITSQTKPLPTAKSPDARGNRFTSFKEAEDSTVRYFEESLDGERTEVLCDNEEQLLNETFATFERLEKETGISSESLIEVLEGSPGLEIPDDQFDSVRVEPDFGALESLEAQNRSLKEHLEKLKQNGGKGKLSADSLLALLQPLPIGKVPAAAHQKPASSTSQGGPRTQDELEHKGQELDVTERKRWKDLSNQLQHVPISLPIETFPPDYRGKIQATLKSLEHALHKPGHHKITRINARRGVPVARLWVDYLSCRPGLLAKAESVPDLFWKSLWDVFESKSTHNLDRMVHLKCVGDDILQAGHRLSSEQRLLHIEATFMHGGQVQAINDWEVMGRTQWSDTNQRKEYLSLGIRIFCATGQVERAEHAAESLLQSAVNGDTYRMLLPIIQACLSREAGSGTSPAWSLYKRFRIGIGEEITMEDYDAVTSMFLGANETNLALQIFTDMMLTGDATTKLTPSQEKILNTVQRRSTGYRLTKSDGSQLNIEDSKSLANLPPQFNNKHFFGSWTKKLIGAGELESVKKVFELMQDRGMCPSSIHMNGLIGAWLREGSEQNRVRAEELAWRMIQARIDFVKQRDAHNFSLPVRSVFSYGKSGIQPINLIPVATMETFTILLQNYRRRRKDDNFADIFDAVKRSKLPIDTRFVNELLWIDTKTAQRRDWVWKTYSTLMNEKATSPDFVTFSILWKNMKRQEDPALGRKQPRFTSCRELFQEMLSKTGPVRRKKEMPRDLYDLIVLSFCYSRDLPGTATAIKALQQHFGFYPDVKTAQMVIGELARVGMVTKRGENPRQLSHQTARQRRQDVTRIFGVLKDRRAEALKEQGLVYEELPQNVRDEEAMGLILDLLRFAHSTFDPAGDSKIGVIATATQAAAEMGVLDSVPWNV